MSEADKELVEFARRVDQAMLEYFRKFPEYMCTKALFEVGLEAAQLSRPVRVITREAILATAQSSAPTPPAPARRGAAKSRGSR
jgi:hypothetical protein